ncbi:Pycsar system effector family protein [Crossiella sp. CA198]|uniref:Pycsar system effector family protein n=1 Tax=Crossiella sp. CA198 TaxID=3455607 RepID=UPI003F8D6D38
MSRPIHVITDLHDEPTTDTPATAAPDPARALATDLAEALTGVHGEHGRADAKAGQLLVVFGAVLAGTIALTRAEITGFSTVLLCLALLPATAAVALLLWVLMPRVTAGGHGFPRWALFTGENTEHLAADFAAARHHADRVLPPLLATQSALAVAKYRHIRRAVFLLLAALPLIALAVLAA